jgi:hypothetical protein
VREREHQFVTQLIDALGQFAGELFVRSTEGKFRPRVDQVRDGFSLREINATIEKRTLREFSWLRETSSFLDTGINYLLLNEW